MMIMMMAIAMMKRFLMNEKMNELWMECSDELQEMRLTVFGFGPKYDSYANLCIFPHGFKIKSSSLSFSSTTSPWRCSYVWLLNPHCRRLKEQKWIALEALPLGCRIIIIIYKMWYHYNNMMMIWWWWLRLWVWLYWQRTKWVRLGVQKEEKHIELWSGRQPAEQSQDGWKEKLILPIALMFILKSKGGPE